MAYRRRFRRRRVVRRRRRFVRRRRPNAFTSRRGLKTQGFPSRLKCTLPFFQRYTLNPGIGGTCASYVFRGNDMYDPDVTGAGHQPRGFDQVMLMFDHFVVIGVRMVVDVHNDDGGGVIVGVTPSDDSGVNSDPRDYIEDRATRYITAAGSGAGPANRRIVYTFNPNKFLSRTKPLSDPDLKGSAGSSPTEQAYLIVWACPTDGSADHGPVNISVRLEYTAVFIEPKLPPMS